MTLTRVALQVLGSDGSLRFEIYDEAGRCLEQPEIQHRDMARPVTIPGVSMAA